MNRHCLLEITDGKARITDHTRSLWLYADIIEKYGEQLALKIFRVYDYMADMSEANPFFNVNELEKLETIIRGVCPEITLEVDWNEQLIDEGIEYTKELYATPKYRRFLAVKILRDRATNTLHNSYLDTTKESGNADQIKKSLELWSFLNEECEKAYSEYLEEQGAVRVRGQGQKVPTRKNNNLPKDLD